MNRGVNSGRELAIFDVCDTLYYSNTTHDFIEFYFNEQGFSLTKLGYNILNHRLSPIRYFLIGFGAYSKLDVLKASNVRMLRGLSHEDITELAERFVDNHLSVKKIDQIHELIQESKDEGRDVVLCSSSLEPVVRSVAQELGVENWLGTSLEFSNGRFSGRIQRDLAGIKHTVIRETFGDIRVSLVVSDNYSDLELLRVADEAIVITHGPRKRKRWAEHGFRIIDV